MIGNVKWFSSERGYGFLTAEDGEDLFFHASRVSEKFRGRDKKLYIAEGLKVEYESEQGKKGLMAVDVRRFGETF